MSEKNPMEQDRELQRLRAMLHEDLDSAADTDEALEVVKQLRRWDAPAPDTASTAQLIARLSHELHTVTQNEVPQRAVWWLLLLRSQIRVVRREIWAASALVMVLGVLVTLATYGQGSGSLPIAVLAPLVATFGVGLLYDTEVEQMLELENSTLASSRTLLLARLMLVFGFDLMLALIASLFLALIHAEVSLWSLIASWLAPMAFLSSLAFLTSVLSRDALFGSVVGLILWGMHILLRSVPAANILTLLLSLPGFSAPETRPFLIILAPILVILALLLVEHDERRIGVTQ